MFPALWSVIAMLILAAPVSADWRKISREEDAEFRQLFSRIWADAEEAAWEGMERLPPHVFFEEMRRLLPSMTDKPKIFERFRGMMLASPEWESWMQWKIDTSRETWESKEGDYQRADGEMMRIPQLLNALGSVETIPYLAQFVLNDEIPVKGYGRAFQRSGIEELRAMLIPGAPQSYSAKDWIAWWEKNKALYVKGPDGRMNGPAPTRFLMMNGKLPARLPPSVPHQAPEQTPAPQRPPATPTAEPAVPSAVHQPAILPVKVPTRANWVILAAVAAGFTLLFLLFRVVRKRRG